MAPRDDGMTLIEMLVVLAIVGAMSGATVLAIGRSSRNDDLESEGQRLAARLNEAVDIAMTTNRALALDWDAQGYRVVSAKDPDSVDNRELGQRRALASSVRLTAPRSPLPLDVDASEPVTLSLVSSDRRVDIRFDGYEASASGVQAR